VNAHQALLCRHGCVGNGQIEALALGFAGKGQRRREQARDRDCANQRDADSGA